MDNISMLDTIITKPLTEENVNFFKKAMAWTCNPVNKAVMFEYNDKYVVGKKEDIPVQEEPTDYAYVSTEERLENIENALIELAELLTEEK